MSFMALSGYALRVFISTSPVSPDSGGYLFAGLVGMAAFGTQGQIWRKVAALEEQVRTARKPEA